MSDHSRPPDPKVWGRRPYADKRARELLNDVSQFIARTRPPDVESPDDPAMSDILRYAGVALNTSQAPDSADVKAATIEWLMGDQGLDFQEAVCWYWFRYCQYDLTEIHYAQSGNDAGGDPEDRRNATRNIIRVLSSAASKVDGEDPDDIPDLVDDRKRHDRTEDDFDHEDP